MSSCIAHAGCKAREKLEVKLEEQVVRGAIVHNIVYVCQREWLPSTMVEIQGKL